MEDKIITAVESAVNNAALLPWRAIMASVAICGVIFGLFMLLRPASAIRIQQRFYAQINWRMEPISMGKEIRNTRLMGAFLIVVILLAAVLVIASGKTFL